MKNINILTIGIVYIFKGVAFRILLHIMPKFANSCIQERIDLMERFVRLFGSESIECLLADREIIHLDTLKPIKIKKYGRRVKSLINMGLITSPTCFFATI